MPKRIKLRPLTTEETTAIRKLARSRTKPARLVQQAQLLVLLLDNPDLPPTKAALQVGFKGGGSGTQWVKRFNEEGIAGLEDKPRSGKPLTHPETVRGQLIEMVTTKPDRLGYPFALWSLPRLQSAFKEKHKVRLSVATIWRWVRAEGLNWRRQESWFHDPEQHDPEFVEKRGPSSRPT